MPVGFSTPLPGRTHGVFPVVGSAHKLSVAFVSQASQPPSGRTPSLHCVAVRSVSVESVQSVSQLLLVSFQFITGSGHQVLR